jgi:hypothetical protein
LEKTDQDEIAKIKLPTSSYKNAKDQDGKEKYTQGFGGETQKKGNSLNTKVWTERQQ